MVNIEEKIRRYIQENQMIMPGDHILAGVSGGADSVCLFFLLQSFRNEMLFGLTVMHVNHGLRETADRDEAFVRQLCERYQVPFVSKHVDVNTPVREQGLSVEEAARLARYQAFREEAAQIMQAASKEPETKKQVTQIKLAVAHHENDQAETVLFQLFRGSSLTGLRGMKPVSRQQQLAIIRPMLCVNRQEIEEYLKDHKLAFVTDETNADNRYARNRIRNEILPAASGYICQEAVRHIAQAAADIGRAEDFLDTILMSEYESVVQRVYGAVQCRENGIDSPEKEEDTPGRKPLTVQMLRIFAQEFQKKHSYLKQELVHRALTELAGVSKDITRQHVESVCSLFEMQVGRQMDLPYQICAKRDYDAVELFLKQKRETPETWEEELVIPGITNLPDGSRVCARVFCYEKTMEIPKNKYTKWFDYDRIRRCPVVRSRKVSDYFYIDERHTKTVKDYMINEKIRQGQREKLCLICEDHHMLWMPGYRISAYYKISGDTRRVLELTYIGGIRDGGEDKCHDF